MKQVLRYLKEYQRSHFDWKLYGTILVFTTICIALNYRFDFEDGVIDSYTGQPIKWLWMFLFHGSPFFIVCLILYAFGKKQAWLTSKSYWVKFIIGFGLLALDRSFYGFDEWFKALPKLEYHFVIRCVHWASSLILVVIPMMILYPFLEKDELRNFYGMSWRKFDPKPYLILLGIAAVFIGIGSFIGDIQDFYPRYKASGAKLYLHANPNVAEGWLVAFYELCYGSNFISVELIFRGFLIFAFHRTLGGYAVLPMVVTYAFLHFGKPMGETISSIFGGYILGIIAFNSRNIWGGIFIHLGVAWLMELFGWMQQ
ncbi:CPBP family intramembrane glutamic endopeptidase [Ekhidna sp.]|uniref:CPBP family intramembrane glutamic endopeptidase n=1 Tax=Ekhidna sp. TaxID=2608089 RepID=UPI003CCBCCE6